MYNLNLLTTVKLIKSIYKRLVEIKINNQFNNIKYLFTLNGFVVEYDIFKIL